MALKEFKYTICPVGNSSYLAANKIWKENTFEKVGGKPVLLQSLPRSEWNIHFDYQDPALFREGGNIPPLWARSKGADVVLIELAFLQQKAHIIVKADSTIDSVEELRGKKLGVPVGKHFIIDFYKATVEHGFETALAAKGIDKREVFFVSLEVNEEFVDMQKIIKVIWEKEK